MTALSILVPIYNVEPYLAQCLKSIQQQTFEDFEVLCINDGSTDESLAIIEEFIKLDNRFKVIDKKNTGYGHSMNVGLAHCSGDYVGIVESDDFIEPDMFDILIALAQQHDLDIARCNYFLFDQHGKIKKDLSYLPTDKVVHPLDYPKIFYQAPSVWANLYRHTFLTENHIRFLETPGASYQDTSFVFKAYALCLRFMFVDKPLLNYRKDNAHSSSNSGDKVFCVCDEYREILRFCKERDTVYQALKFHIPMLRFKCYSWNFARIDTAHKLPFLKAWRDDITLDFKEKRISRHYISTNKLKKMMLIRHFPRWYTKRKNPL